MEEGDHLKLAALTDTTVTTLLERILLEEGGRLAGEAFIN